MSKLTPPPRLLEAVGAIGAAEPVAAGFSGGHVFRVRTIHGDRAIKAWPANVSLARIQQVHQVQHFASGLAPKLDRFGDTSFIRFENRFWESARWIDGRPLDVSTSLDDVLLGVDAIGRFHQLTVKQESRLDVAPAILDRIEISNRLISTIERLKRARQGHQRGVRVWSGNRSNLDSKVPFAGDDSALQETLDHALDRICLDGIRAMKEIGQRMQQHAAERSALHWCLRDVHREHILFQTVDSAEPAFSVEPSSGGVIKTATGILDWDAVRIDVAETDLSRWMSSFSLVGHSLDEIALAATERFLADPATRESLQNRSSTRLVVDLMVATAWISLAQWCVWLFLENRTFPVSSAAQAERIRFWCDQLSRRPGIEID